MTRPEAHGFSLLRTQYLLCSRRPYHPIPSRRDRISSHGFMVYKAVRAAPFSLLDGYFTFCVQAHAAMAHPISFRFSLFTVHSSFFECHYCPWGISTDLVHARSAEEHCVFSTEMSGLRPFICAIGSSLFLGKCMQRRRIR